MFDKAFSSVTLQASDIIICGDCMFDDHPSRSWLSPQWCSLRYPYDFVPFCSSFFFLISSVSSAAAGSTVKEGDIEENVAGAGKDLDKVDALINQVGANEAEADNKEDGDRVETEIEKRERG